MHVVCFCAHQPLCSCFSCCGALRPSPRTGRGALFCSHCGRSPSAAAIHCSKERPARPEGSLSRLFDDLEELRRYLNAVLKELSLSWSSRDAGGPIFFEIECAMLARLYSCNIISTISGTLVSMRVRDVCTALRDANLASDIQRTARSVPLPSRKSWIIHSI